MKLIDLLVRELPKRGGWPEMTDQIHQDHDGDIYLWRNNACRLAFNLNDIADNHRPYAVSESKANMVTRDQYQSTLAAPHKVEWDGAGLPPVGVEFEYGTHRTKAKCMGIGHHMIFASKGNPDDEESDYEEFMISILDSEFRPLRSEADKKRDAAISAMVKSTYGPNEYTYQEICELVYADIAAGKIPGVKLED